MSAESEIKMAIIGLAEFFGQKLSENQVRMYFQVLADVPLDALKKAAIEITHDPSIQRFPLPAVIRAKYMPSDSIEGQARESAARIIGAVGKFGYTNADKAQAYIGSLGWEAVKLFGGWDRLCQTVDQGNIPTLTAQFRELCTSVGRRAKLGIINRPPELPNAGPQLIELRNLLKQLPKEGA